MTPRIIIPHGLAAAVLAVLTRRSDRWTDEDELVDTGAHSSTVTGAYEAAIEMAAIEVAS
jgi:hypothetical protein